MGKNFSVWSIYISGKYHCVPTFGGKSLNYEPHYAEVKGQCLIARLVQDTPHIKVHNKLPQQAPNMAVLPTVCRF